MAIRIHTNGIVMISTGMTGIGKTVENFKLINNFINNKDKKFDKIFVLDYSDEYTDNIIEKSGFNLKIPIIEFDKLEEWCDSDFLVGRITAFQSILNNEMSSYTNYHNRFSRYLRCFKNTLIIIEDYHLGEIHTPFYKYINNNCSLLILADSLSRFSHKIIDESDFVRFHYQLDDAVRYRTFNERISLKYLVLVAQKIVNKKYSEGIKMFVYINISKTILIGNFTEDEYNNIVSELKIDYPKIKLDYLDMCNGNIINGNVNKKEEDNVDEKRAKILFNSVLSEMNSISKNK